MSRAGKKLPPPPRKLIIERLAPLPPKPQSVIIERWLPYTQPKRRVIFQRARASAASTTPPPKNVIVQWAAPTLQLKRELKDLGVVRADPREYSQRYGASLRSVREMPAFVLEVFF